MRPIPSRCVFFLLTGGLVTCLAFCDPIHADESPDKDKAAMIAVEKAIERGDVNQAVAAAMNITTDSARYETVQRIANLPSESPGGNIVNAAANTSSAGGGAAAADFDTLIDMITTTVAPETWEEVGGTGTVAGFPTGVLLDARRRNVVQNQTAERPLRLTGGAGVAGVEGELETSDQFFSATAVADGMRSVSLPRLESALLARFATGLPPTEAMLNVGGLARIELIAVYPETGDVVLVGPVAEVGANERGLHLSDLAVSLHNALHGAGKVVCAITPDQANLARTQAYLTETGKRPLKPGQRKHWLDGLREALGKQDVQFEDVEPDSHMALTLLAADYHMKLIGMGIKPGGAVESYLETVQLNEDGSAPEMAVLRWWFTLLPTAVETNEAKDVFRLPRHLLQVQSENEMLAAQGKRVHTGMSEPLNRAYAARFTRNFPALAAQYPIYAQLHRSAELMVACSLMRDQRLCERVAWQPTFLVSQDPYLVPPVVVPRQVDTVVNHRVLNRKTIIAGISGGVDFDPRALSDQVAVREEYALGQRRAAAPAVSRHEARQSAGAGELRWSWD